VELLEKSMWPGSRDDVAFWQEADFSDVLDADSYARAACVLWFLVLLLVLSLEDEALQTARRLGPRTVVPKPFEFVSRAARAGCPRAMQSFNLKVATGFVFRPPKRVFLDRGKEVLRYRLINIDDA
jgi:hypothetical protein